MSILLKYSEAFESKNENEINDCLHDDYAFTNYSQGKVFNKSDVANLSNTNHLINFIFIRFHKTFKLPAI